MTDGIAVPARYFAILAVSAGSLLVMIDASIATVALPVIADVLQVSASRTVLLITLYQLILAMTIIPFAALSDQVGQRRMYRCGMVVYAFAAIACLAVDSFPVLLAIRSVQALSAAAALSVTFGLIRSIYPAKYLGRGLAISTLCTAGGNALAPAIGGLILSVASWRWVFVVGAPLAVASLLAGKYLPDVGGEKQRFDVLGATLCAVTFALVILGCDALGSSSNSWRGSLLLATGLIVGALFVFHERRQRNRVLPLDLLRRPAFALAITGSLAGVVASMAVLFSLPFRLHELGFGPAEMGAMIAPYAVASFMIAPAAGALSDRISPKTLGTCGLAVAMLAMLLIAFLSPQAGYWDVAWRVWLCGAGFALFQSPNARIVLASGPANRAAAGGGLITTTRMLGQALSATLVGALLAIGAGNGPWPALMGVAVAGVSMVCNLLQPGNRADAIEVDSSTRAAEG